MLLRSLRYLVAIALALLLVACGELDMKEAGYRNNLKDYDELIENASGDTKKAFKAKKKAYEEAHDKLPKDEKERIAALLKLNEAADKELKVLEDVAKESVAAEAKLMKAYQKKFVGTWATVPDGGDEMLLRIEDEGKVYYERKAGGVNKSLTGASVKKFRRAAFEVSLLGIGTTFKIDQEPTQEKGVWYTSIDGVKLMRVAGPTGDLPDGTFTCNVLHKDICVDHSDHFATDTPLIKMSYLSTDVPKSDVTLTVKWIAEDVGSAAPPNTQIASIDRSLKKGDIDDAENINLWSSMKKPEKGWAAGKYRIEVLRNGKPDSKTNFVVDAPAAKP